LIAEVLPESIGYIEAHGTGTALGDPIEIAALTKAFRKWTSRKQFCPIGSVKANIGHLDAGAGAAGIIKAVLAMEHAQIPASINYTAPNPEIDFSNSPFYVNDQTTAWPERPGPKRAGVSSFGLGGTNAHIILEEAPSFPPSARGRSHELLLLSARSEGVLSEACQRLADHLRHRPDQNLADVAFTLQAGRHAFRRRTALACKDMDQAISSLEALQLKATSTVSVDSLSDRIAFMFSGQGSQYVNMGRGLYEGEAVFRSEMDRCFEILRSAREFDLKGILYPAEGKEAQATQELLQTSITQPALFAIEYAMARQWMAWGIRPSAMAGHSIGEYVAACLAGVLPLPDALTLVCERGGLMQGLPLGSMLAVPLQERQIALYLKDGLSLAVINAPALCVVSGEQESIRQLQDRLSHDGVESRVLHTSHAFHSKMMEPILEPFAKTVSGIQLQPPAIPFTSNVTGTWITPLQAMDPMYWASHIRQTVRFADCLETLYENGNQVLLEVGPGRTLSAFASQHPAKPKGAKVMPSIRHPKESSSDTAFLLETLGSLWTAGIEVDWSQFQGNYRRRRIPLPTYPFERKRYWIQPGASAPLQSAVADIPTSQGHVVFETSALRSPTEAMETSSGEPRTDMERALKSIWQGLLGVSALGIHDNFFEIGGSSLLATRLFTQIAGQFGQRLPLPTIFEAPTIHQLAAMLEQQVPSIASSSLIKVQAGASRPPLLCLPGNLGNVYHDLQYLSRHLGSDQPVYGFQDGLGHPSDVRKLAAHFIEDIYASGLRPPYHLTGICSGSVVAFEMAQQLTRKGEEVAFLALVEPASLPLPGARSYLDLLEEIWGRFSHHIGDHSRTVKNLNLSEKVMFIRLRLKLIANLWEMKRYMPQEYPGPIHIFLTQESIDSSPRSGWAEYAIGGAEIQQIPGTHRTITGDYTAIEEAHMKVLGELIRERIEILEASGRRPSAGGLVG
jgi:phthiocerol/phenolphthiocerol synthesis type-I polyketide synthase E